MNQSENVAYAMSPEQITFYAKIQGAGAAAPVRAPTTYSATSAIGYMHPSNNFAPIVATDITRPAGAGVYTMKLKDSLPVILNIHAEVWGPVAASKNVVVQDYNPTTRVLSFTVVAEATGAAADLLSTEFVTFTIIGIKSIPTY